MTARQATLWKSATATHGGIRTQLPVNNNVNTADQDRLAAYLLGDVMAEQR